MRLNVFIFLGPEGPGAAERWVAGGRLAAARDAVGLVSQLPDLARIVLATSESNLPDEAADLAVEWDLDLPAEAFHFGRRLAGLMARFPADVYLYLGAGSLPLLPLEVLANAVAEVGRSEVPAALTNNLHSSDWMVLNCPEAVAARVERLASDNSLGWVLRTEAGVTVRSLPPSAATRLDIDTPADLLLLALHPRTGPALERYLHAQPRDFGHWLSAGQHLFTPGGQAALIGRVSSGVWSQVEAHTQAWIRVFSEERGMAASGRLAAGQVKSLLGEQLVRLGPARFFASLSEMAEAVFFDTRVVLAHAGRWPSAADRYASDLGRPGEITDGWLREFTQAAIEAPIPIVLGGHGVVAGDLYGLVEIAQAGALPGAAVYNRTRMPNILFVCTANICRSPVAEVIFADWLQRQSIPGDWQVTSAGTWASPGLAASAYSREALAEQGLNLGDHRSRRVEREILENTDVVLCMTRSQCEALQVEFSEHAGRVHLLTAMAGPGYDIADPYGGPRDGYVAMAAELRRLIEAAGPRIVALAGQPSRANE